MFCTPFSSYLKGTEPTKQEKKREKNSVLNQVWVHFFRLFSRGCPVNSGKSQIARRAAECSAAGPGRREKKKTSSPSELHMTRIILIIVTSRIWSQKKKKWGTRCVFRTSQRGKGQLKTRRSFPVSCSVPPFPPLRCLRWSRIL